MTDDKQARDELPPLTIDLTVALTRPATIKAYQYWLSLKGGRAMPTRADITPAALREVLPQIALVDVPRPGEPSTAYVTRLAGDAIQRVFGPITGRPLNEIVAPELLPRWIRSFEAARNAAAPVRVASRVSFQKKTWLQAEVLFAPLGEGGDITTLFAAIDIWPADEA